MFIREVVKNYLADFAQKTFRLVGGLLSWSETPYFHKGGLLQMVPKLPLSAEM